MHVYNIPITPKKFRSRSAYNDIYVLIQHARAHGNEPSTVGLRHWRKPFTPLELPL